MTSALPLRAGLALAFGFMLAGEWVRETLKIPPTPANQRYAVNLVARINAWWVMVVVIGVAFWLGTGAVILLFYAVSFYALREFLTLTPTRRAHPPSAAQLAAALKRSTFLLSSARLAITDPVARRIATEAVEEAQGLLRRFEGRA